jgi:Delta carbonic anhydrase
VQRTKLPFLFDAHIRLLSSLLLDSIVNPSEFTRSASGGKDGNMNIFSRSVPTHLPPIINRGENVCQGKDPGLSSADCIIDAMINVGPQAGANVTDGYQGNMLVDHGPITTPFWMNAMCPVNVHWHLGAEHLSVGQYDENGIGPAMEKVEGEIQRGHQCNFYDDNDPKFTRPYEWLYCKDMKVGETYEVHWPHSAAGACGTPNQYQTPFQDGVFCIDGVLEDTASQVGVQAQVFVVVNDDTYFWPDLISGMIVDGKMGSDVAKYTGSTTGANFDNDVCSQYSPITWHVDRKCHLISATSFDKLCYDMLLQRDDMSGDLEPHGSRETVKDDLAANNQVRKLRG